MGQWVSCNTFFKLTGAQQHLTHNRHFKCEKMVHEIKHMVDLTHCIVVLQVTPEDVMNAAPDPLAPVSAYVVQHMNEDHADSLTAMVKHFTGLTVDKTQLVSMDKGRMKCRLPYTRHAFYFAC